MKSPLIPLAALILAAAPAWSAGYSCNPNGAVVTLDDGAVYYLGRTCDAARKGGGTGHWHLAASAFVVVIDGEALRLPVEVDCPSLPACWSR